MFQKISRSAMFEEIVLFLFFCIHCFHVSFLYHEDMHVRSQGVFNTGTINVKKYGYTVYVDNKTRPGWCRLSGGLLSGLVYLFFGSVLWYYGLWFVYIPMTTSAMINLCYGFWEWKKGAEGRYKVYVITFIIMLMFWIFYALVIGV